MWTLLLFLIVLSILVFVHELGHFLVAKKMGMKVEEFGFGFPPRLFGVKRKQTIYSINWIPLGGFVRIKGESGEFQDEPDSFSSKKAWQRFLVIIAGVTMNFILAAVLFSVGFMVGFPSVIDENLPQSAHVSESALTIMTVLDNSPAHQAGVQSGDKIISINGQSFVTSEEAREYISQNSDKGIDLVTSGTAGENTYHLNAKPLEGTDIKGVGIGFIQTGLVSYSFFEAILQGVVTTAQYTVEIIRVFVDLIVSLLTGHGLLKDLSGPVGIAVMTGQVASLGLIYFLQFIAVLSINLCVINALPFPALDGGRILFLIIEKLRGKSVDAKIETMVHNFGFLLLMVLVIFVTYKDFVHFGDQIIGAVIDITL